MEMFYDVITTITAIVIIFLSISLIYILSNRKTTKKADSQNEPDYLLHQQLTNCCQEQQSFLFDFKLLLKIVRKLDEKIEAIDRDLYLECAIRSISTKDIIERQKEMNSSLDKLVRGLDSENSKLRCETISLQQENIELRLLNRRLRNQIDGIE